MILALVSIPPMSVKGALAALPHVIKRHDEEKAYRIWVTESWSAYCNGKMLTTSYADLIDPPPPPPPEDPRSCAEIASGIWERIRGD